MVSFSKGKKVAIEYINTLSVGIGFLYLIILVKPSQKVF